MKKLIMFILTFLVFSVYSVNALECPNTVIDLKKVKSFECFDVGGETITFKNKSTGETLTSVFEIEVKDNKKINIKVLDANIVFDRSVQNGEIVINDGANEDIIKIKNYAYIAPTTTTVVTTTKDPNIKTLVVKLNPGNGKDIIEKKCEVNSNNTICSVTLPKLDDANFNGWGTQPTCKEGKSGTIRVDKDIMYYACFDGNTVNNTTSTITTNVTTTSPINEDNGLFLKSLKVINKDTNEDIDIGIFSIKKYDYEFKVLNDVKNIDIKTDVGEGITVNIEGNLTLNEGANKIILKLTDEDNNTKEYSLNINRLKEGETLNTKVLLKSLVVGGFNINFNSQVFNYELEVDKDINSLEINAIAEDEESEVVISGEDSITDGSVVTVSVIQEDGDSVDYLIEISKNKGISLMIIIALVVVLILIIILVILIIVKSKNKTGEKVKKVKKNKTKKEEVEVLNI